MSTKIGFNVLSFHVDDHKSDRDYRKSIRNTGAGIWLPDVNAPNSIILGRYMDVGCKWLQDTTGNDVKIRTFGKSVINKWNLRNFIRCCKILKANPIVGVSVFQPVDEAVFIVRAIRSYGFTNPIYLCVGNESYLGKVRDPVTGWPDDYPAEQYIEAYREIKAAIDDIGVQYGAVLVDAVKWPSPNRNEWDTKVLAALGGDIDWGSIHIYDKTAGQAQDIAERHHASSPDLPFIVTEWNHPKHGEMIDSEDIYSWTLDMLQLWESLPYVIGHTIWDSSCGLAWKLFERNYEPTIQWRAFEAFARKD